MSAKQPFVSVIVPAYNSADVVGQCIEALLDQEYPKDRYEVIIVDNDSTDGTAAVIRRYPVTYVLESKVHTAAAARNAGARSAKGEALAFCDADQVATRQWLRELMSHWGENGHAGFVGPAVLKAYGKGIFELYNEQFEGSCVRGDSLEEVEEWGAGNLCVRATDFREAGGFSQSMAAGEDTELCRRLCELTGERLLYIPTALQHHRARRSALGSLRRRFRLGYSMERHGAVRMGRPVLLAAWFWLRMPLLVLKILLLGARRGRKVALIGAVIEPPMNTAELLGRLAYRAGVSEDRLRAWW